MKKTAFLTVVSVLCGTMGVAGAAPINTCEDDIFGTCTTWPSDPAVCMTRLEQSPVVTNLQTWRDSQVDPYYGDVYMVAWYNVAGVPGDYVAHFWVQANGNYSAVYGVNGQTYYEAWATQDPSQPHLVDYTDALAGRVVSLASYQAERVMRAKGQLFGVDAFMDNFLDASQLAGAPLYDKDSCKIVCQTAAAVGGAVVGGASIAGCLVATRGRNASACKAGGFGLGASVTAFIGVKCEKKCEPRVQK